MVKFAQSKNTTPSLGVTLAAFTAVVGELPRPFMSKMSTARAGHQRSSRVSRAGFALGRKWLRAAGLREPWNQRLRKVVENIGDLLWGKKKRGRMSADTSSEHVKRTRQAGPSS